MLALVTAVSARELDPDLEPLRAAFSAQGVETEIVAWDDPAVAWGRFDAAILRSTWDYVDRFDEFQAWLSTTDEVTRIVNSLDTIGWNIDKHYLAELAADGVATVPTSFVGIGEPVPELDVSSAVWVVKPTIGAGSNGARRCTLAEVADHVAVLHSSGRAAMVQPYLDMIDEHAETSLVYLPAAESNATLVFDHAFRKGAILTSTDIEREGGLFAKEEISTRDAWPTELDLAEQVLASAPVRRLGPLAYARVDVVPTAEGSVLLELELVEPSLYFRTSAGSADRAAAAWMRFLDEHA